MVSLVAIDTRMSDDPFSLLNSIGVNEILKGADIDESLNFVIPSIFGYCMVFNKTTHKHHELKTYTDNMDLLISREINKHTDILEL
jgi:hypothetical protein